MKILLPVAFDSTSENAFYQAYALAQQADAKLYILTVYEKSGKLASLSQEEAREEWDKKIREFTREKLKKFTQLYPNIHDIGSKKVEMEHLVREKPLWAAISAAKDKYEIDLIAWPHRAFKPILEILLSEPDLTELLENIKGRILVLPKKHRLEAIERIVFGGLLKEAEVAQVSQVVQVKKAWRVKELNLVKIVEEGQEEQEEKMDVKLAKEKLHKTGVDHILVERNKSVLRGLESSIEDPAREILCVYLPHQTIVDKLVHYHLSRELIHKTDLGVLLVVV